MRTGVKNRSGVDEYDAETVFYKKELISITLTIGSDPSEFIDILTTKYGEPNKVNKMTKESCKNEYGVSTEHDNGTSLLEWGEGASIQANLGVVRLDCGKRSGSYYTVDDRAKNILISTLEGDMRREAIKKYKQSKAAVSKL